MGLYKKLVDKFCDFLTVHDGERIASQSPPENVTAVCDVNYANDDELYNKLDVYYPAGAENELLPTIIDVHGGGLHQNICAVGIIFHHTTYSADLSFDPVQTVDQFFSFFL